MNWLFIALSATGLLYCLYEAWKGWRAAHLIAKTLTTRAQDVQSGLTEVRGKVARDSPLLQAPVSGRECAFFCLLVEEYRSSKDGGSWRPALRDSRPATLLLRDYSGDVEVILVDAQFELVVDSHRESGTFNDPPPELQARLSRQYGYDTQGLIFNKSLRYTEQRLAPGDDLYVLGNAAPGNPPTIQAGDHPFIVSDKAEVALVNDLQMRAFLWTAGVVGCAILLVIAIMIRG